MHLGGKGHGTGVVSNMHRMEKKLAGHLNLSTFKLRYHNDTPTVNTVTGRPLTATKDTPIQKIARTAFICPRYCVASYFEFL